MTRMTSIEARFAEYDRLNPQVWILFKQYAHRAWRSGLRRVSASMIVDRIRWEQNVETIGNEPFKINDQFTAYYARKFQVEFPEYAGMFTTRALRSEGRMAA